jgi:hypothetical protein
VEHPACARTHDASPHAHRRPVLTDKESLLFFGVSKQQAMTVRFTVRIWTAFISFCVAGYLEHFFLIRFGFGWFVLGYVVTLAGMIVWLRQSWHAPKS